MSSYHSPESVAAPATHAGAASIELLIENLRAEHRDIGSLIEVLSRLRQLRARRMKIFDVPKALVADAPAARTTSGRRAG